VRNSVRRADGESSIKYSCKKCDSATPAGGVVPIRPYKGITGMLFRHYGDYNDRDNSSGNNLETK